MIACSSILLCIVLIRSVHGTFFPPVNNPPPIPSQAVRNPNNPQHSFNSPENLPRDFSETREEGFFQPEERPDEERWYFEESQSEELRRRQSSNNGFDEYYSNGESVIGPVATPIPDDAYSAQSSGISNSNPRDIGNVGNSGIFIEGPDRWIEVQIAAERLAENVNQDTGVPFATDTVKSVVGPVPFDIPTKTQFPPNPAINIVQVRPSNAVELQKIYTNLPRTVGSITSVKQVAGVPQPPPPPPFKTVIQQQIINDVPPIAIPPPAPAQISSKQSFSLPPPPPPPLKGVDNPPKIISSVPVNVIPDPNVVVSSKNIIPDSSVVSGKSVVQQVRHVWIPTSSKTGKFITIPISATANSKVSNINKGLSLDSTPITVSDTWVLKQDGPVPVFEKQKSAPSVSSPIVQNGKVIFQNPTIVEVDGPPNPIIAKVDSPKNAPIAEKSIAPMNPIDIWPARKELTSPKILGNFPPVFRSDELSAAVKSNTAIIGKSSSEFLPTPQKSIVTDTKSSFLPPISPQPLQIVNGKPCPLPLPAQQKSFYSPLNSGLISIPSIISTQKRLPFARIIRVNRYPTGSYYLLNRSIRPSYFAYPSQTIIQEPKTGLINIIQTRQIPAQLQSNIPLPPVKSKQISIPVLSKQIAYSLPAKQLAYPYIPRQVLLPATPPKSSRIIYPTAQAIKYVYPWNTYLASNPNLVKGSPLPEFSNFRVGSKGSESESSSSESSSENSSSENSSVSSKEKKEEKSKKEKPKKEEKPKSVENSNSNESGKESESESESKSKEIESEDLSAEKESKENLETTESQISE